MIIALTGATGFIGQRLATRLLAEGHTVRALVRSPSRNVPLSAEQVPGDLLDAASLRRLVSGADALMHLAGAVRGGTAADFDIPNVTGTRTLIEQCDAVSPGIPILLFSSLAAREPGLSYYSSSKRQAEAVLATSATSPWLILRPPAVYGPGDREMLPVFRFMRITGLAPCAGSRHDRLSLVFVDDLVDAAVAWLPRGRDLRGVCTLHDGHDNGYGWQELATVVGDLCHRRIRVWELPRRLMDLAARTNSALAGVSGRKPMLSPQKLRELRHADWVCDNTDISALIDWQPSTSLREGLARTPGWND